MQSIGTGYSAGRADAFLVASVMVGNMVHELVNFSDPQEVKNKLQELAWLLRTKSQPARMGDSSAGSKF